MKFPNTHIFAIEDPDYIFMEFNGKVELIDGRTYENQYLATFRFKDGKILEYVEYFNPIILAKTFGIPI